MRPRRRRPTGPLPPKPKLPEGKAPGEPEKKAERLKRLVAEGAWDQTIRLAVRAGYLRGDDKTAVERAREALERPAFCRELGRDPDTLIADGRAVLRRCFGPKPPRTR